MIDQLAVDGILGRLLVINPQAETEAQRIARHREEDARALAEVKDRMYRADRPKANQRRKAA